MIPRIAHFYWGADTLPLLRFATLWSFREYNPDWQIILYQPLRLTKEKTWRTAEQKDGFEEGQDWSHKLDEIRVTRKIVTMKDFRFTDTASEVTKSDLLRWHLLAEQGGLWSDMDILYVKPISAFLTQPESDTYVCHTNPPSRGRRGAHRYHYHSIGFLLSSGNNPFYRRLSQVAVDHYCPRDYQSLGSLLIGSYYPPERISKAVVNIPMEVVYPYDSLHIPAIFGESTEALPQESIGLHWYGGHRLSSEFQRQLEYNGGPPDCLLGRLLKEFLHSYGLNFNSQFFALQVSIPPSC